MLHFAIIFFTHYADFNEIFDKKKLANLSTSRLKIITVQLCQWHKEVALEGIVSQNLSLPYCYYIHKGESFIHMGESSKFPKS